MSDPGKRQEEENHPRVHKAVSPTDEDSQEEPPAGGEHQERAGCAGEKSAMTARGKRQEEASCSKEDMPYRISKADEAILPSEKNPQKKLAELDGKKVLQGIDKESVLNAMIEKLKEKKEVAYQKENILDLKSNFDEMLSPTEDGPQDDIVYDNEKSDGMGIDYAKSQTKDGRTFALPSLPSLRHLEKPFLKPILENLNICLQGGQMNQKLTGAQNGNGSGGVNDKVTVTGPPLSSERHQKITERHQKITTNSKKEDENQICFGSTERQRTPAVQGLHVKSARGILRSDTDTLMSAMDTPKPATMKSDMDTSKSDTDTMKSAMDTPKSDKDALKSDTPKSDTDTPMSDTDTPKSDTDTMKSDMDTMKSDTDTMKSKKGTLKPDMDTEQWMHGSPELTDSMLSSTPVSQSFINDPVHLRRDSSLEQAFRGCRGPDSENWTPPVPTQDWLNAPDESETCATEVCCICSTTISAGNINDMCPECFEDFLRKTTLLEGEIIRPPMMPLAPFCQVDSDEAISQPLITRSNDLASFLTDTACPFSFEGSPETPLPVEQPPTSTLSRVRANKKKNRCTLCDKKVKLTEISWCVCRCGNLFCSKHRLSEMHNCSFDYKTNGRRHLEKENPQIIAQKVIPL